MREGTPRSPWRAALAPLGTDASKPFLETAPWLIVFFYEASGYAPDGGREKRRHVMDSVGIAPGAEGVS